MISGNLPTYLLHHANPEPYPFYPPAPNPEQCAVYSPAPNDRPMHKDWTRAASGLEVLNVSRMSRYTEPRPKVVPWEKKAAKQQLTKTSHCPLHIKGQLKGNRFCSVFSSIFLSGSSSSFRPGSHLVI